MRPGRFIQLNEQEREALRELYRQTKDADLRSCCQMLLLSAAGHRAGEIAELTLFDENSVLFWFDRYEAEGLDGFEDRTKSGRPPKSRSVLPGSVADNRRASAPGGRAVVFDLDLPGSGPLPGRPRASIAERRDGTAAPAPKLNLIERLWKHLHRKLTHNYLFDCMADLVAAVTKFLTNLDRHRSEVLSVIGDHQ